MGGGNGNLEKLRQKGSWKPNYYLPVTLKGGKKKKAEWIGIRIV
jgi:hypothetical protein